MLLLFSKENGSTTCDQLEEDLNRGLARKFLEKEKDDQ